MSLAAIERGIPSVFKRLDQGSLARGRNLEIGKQVQFATRAIENPNIIFLQNYLEDREIAGSSFISASARELKDDLAEPVEFLARKAAPVVATAIVLTGCGPREAQNIVTNPVDPSRAAAACEPEPYAKQIGIPTPVGIGGGPKDVPPPADILAIRFKIEHCDPITPQEIQRAREFNIQTENSALVNQAMLDGKIEVNNQAEAAQLFTPVSQEKAVQLEAKAKETGQDGFFIPVKNIEKRSNFQAKEFVVNNESPALGLIGIQPGDELVSLKSGSVRIIRPGKSELSNFYVIEVNTESAIFQIYVKDPDAHEKIKAGASESVVLKPGDAILELVSPKKLPEIYGGYDLVIAKKVGNKFQKISIEEIIRIDNQFSSLVS